MKTLIDKFNEMFKNESYFLDENGNVIIEKVKTSAFSLDFRLIDILLSNQELRDAFFVERNGVLIFDKVKFAWILSNTDFLPDSYTSYKNKIGLTDLDGNFIKAKNDVMLSFPYKDCILEFDSTEENERREEVFLNEILAKDYIDTLLKPKILVNATFHDRKGSIPISVFDNDNLLIKGNNLIGLYSLLPKYEKSIKCMYWDILYNTDGDQVPYNDSFKHSSWLTMMKNRLLIARDLLREDGLMFIQCNDIEMAYLKVLCDEIFFRENYVNTITIKTKIAGVSGSSEGKSLIDATEFILLYAKTKALIKLNPASGGVPLLDVVNEYKENGKSWKYITVLVDKGEKVLIKEDQDKGYTYYGYKNTVTNSIKKFAEEKGLSEEEVYEKYYSSIFRTTNAQSSVRQTVEDETGQLNYDFVGLEYIPIKGKNGGKKIEILYRGESRAMVTFLGDMIMEDSNGKPLYRDRVSTIWTDIDYNNLKKEGSVELPFGKKPEKIIARILEIATNEGDTVLDAYFGTGTTGAVAMKMNRKFIGLEQLSKHYELSIERLTNVVNGDPTGISSIVEWKGGGSFVTCELKVNNDLMIEKIKYVDDAGAISFFESILKSPFLLNYKIDMNILKEKNNLELFRSLDLDSKKKILISILDKNLLYVNYSEIDDEETKICESDRDFTKSFYRD